MGFSKGSFELLQFNIAKVKINIGWLDYKYIGQKHCRSWSSITSNEENLHLFRARIASYQYPLIMLLALAS